MAFLEDIKNFLLMGNNLYYIIAALFVIIVLIIVIHLSSKKSKKVTKEQSETEKAEIAKPKVYEDSQLFSSTVKNNDSLADEDNELLHIPESDDAGDGVFTNEDETKEDQVDNLVEIQPIAPHIKPVKPDEVIVESEEVISFDTDETDISSATRPGIIMIYLDTADKFRFRIKSSNGNIVGHSQGYKAKASCKNAIRAIVNIANDADVLDTIRYDARQSVGMSVFEIYKDTDDKFRFRLKAANLNTILASQGYKSKDGCYNGIKSLRNIALNHNLIDATKQ
ncbi:MAG: YegP family protein [Christensenellaceae bacterium]|jgi:uncharacterized protein YegP (UPF0339 family)|nr:YegP family protein [Christensenellaceae bacterium]